MEFCVAHQYPIADLSSRTFGSGFKELAAHAWHQSGQLGSPARQELRTLDGLRHQPEVVDWNRLRGTIEGGFLVNDWTVDPDG